MNRRDRDLLSKQLRWLSPSSRNDGVMVCAIVAAFVAGISLGALAAHKSDLMKIVSYPSGEDRSPGSVFVAVSADGRLEP